MAENNNLLIGIVIAIAVFSLLGMFGFGGMIGCGGVGSMMGNLGYGLGGMWIFGWLFMILILVALILFILWLVKQLQNPKSGRMSKR